MNIKFYNKLYACLTSGVVAFSMCSCSNDENQYYTSSDSFVVPIEVVPDVTSVSSSLETTSTTTSLVTSLTTTTSTTTVTDVTTSDYTSFITNTTSVTTSYVESESDKDIEEHFSSIGEDIKNSVDTDSFLSKGKSYFVYCVDFLFYDGEINGIKFSDLTSSAKQQLLIDVDNIDSLICSKFPNYKETISEGSGKVYNKAAEIIKAGSKNVKDFSKEKLGQENYDKLKEYKDMFMETAFGDFDEFKDILKKGKSKIKEWYEGLR